MRPATLDRNLRGMDHPRKYAARSGKSELYKFRAYSTEMDHARVEEILVSHEVYFARPSQLNDPFDMSPRFEKPTREELIQGAEVYFSKRPHLAQERDAKMRFFRECDLDEHVQRAQTRARLRLESGYSVFSLAGDRSHPMLWSHYAGGHTGLCIHFHAGEGSLMGLALEVTYRCRSTYLHFPSAKRSIGCYSRKARSGPTRTNIGGLAIRTLTGPAFPSRFVGNTASSARGSLPA